MITILRLGHRHFRDQRISTHLGLVARTFGADKIVYSGEKDEHLMKSLEDVVNRWGGKFEIGYEKNWKRLIKNFNGVKIHLTMYGLPFQRTLKKISKKKDMLIIVGGEKVPPEVYELADYNIAIHNQPHSEVAALAITLYEINDDSKEFKNAEIMIIPQKKGKKVVEKK